MIVALALGLALAIQAWLVKPYQIPSGSMEPTLDIGQRVLVNRFIYHFEDPSIGDIVVFHPPAGADRGTECGVPHSPREACPRPTPQESSQNFIKRIVAGPGDTLSVRERPSGRQRRGEERRALHQPLRHCRRLQFAESRSTFRRATTS